MGYPYDFESNFELGTNADWDSESDTDSVLDIAHYTDLARYGMAPYKGAYCMRVVLAGGTNDAILIEGDIDSSATKRSQTQFWLQFGLDFTATADEAAANLFELQQAGGTVEAAFGYKVTAATDVINLGIGELTPTTFSTIPIQRGVWYLIEIDAVNDPGANDGTIDLYVTPDGAGVTAGAVHCTQVGSLNQGAIGRGALGAQLHLATTTGTILFDEFKFDGGAADNTRTQMDLDRWNREIRITKSGHAFVGPGVISNLTLVGLGAAVQTLRLWDTDEARFPVATGGFGAPRAELHTDVAGKIVESQAVPIHVTKGAYIELDTADTSALVQVAHASAWGSESNVVRYGLAR